MAALAGDERCGGRAQCGCRSGESTAVARVFEAGSEGAAVEEAVGAAVAGSDRAAFFAIWLGRLLGQVDWMGLMAGAAVFRWRSPPLGEASGWQLELRQVCWGVADERVF